MRPKKKRKRQPRLLSEFTLKVPNKVKLLLWRAYTDSFPTMYNLFKKKIVPDSTCYLRMKESETILHMLWTCDASWAK